MYVWWVWTTQKLEEILGSVDTVWILGVLGRFWQCQEAGSIFARNKRNGWYL